ncbi:ZIP zinc transporter-domain-containing protein [Catenaria anguillulae PL171]|uniref:ZIP zinc transporter-domain-containing protein n=1 Tax=Catenaria anguillulae PL171 TaxID=765915 RepID=A0A1Y2I311_9FUNG|nr:ZIP zinc transporter-domain-containing protein [Catenaria anguillulae PL171]
MAASFGRLLALAIAMFCASFFAGHLPLSVTLSERAMAFTTVFGAGMIVGTALVVILPEGVETLAASQAQKTRVESNQSGHQHRKRDSRLAEKAVPELSPRSPWPQPLPAETTPSPPNPPPATAPATGGSDHDHDHEHEHEHEEPRLNRMIGTSLLVGGPSYSSASGQSVLAATIGLVIHSFSDGVAMGAASAAALPALETAVFLAILLHKGPSAFGLTTYLMHHGTVSTRRIRSHLLAFSLAAPLAAITTFLALRGGGGNDRDIAKWTGLLLLFSAGSFLYVATVHVLPEVLARRGGHLSAGQVAAMVVGMMVPILIQVDHHH